MKHYLESTEKVLESVQTTTDGLNGDEAAKRLEQNGKNKLAEGKKESLIHRFSLLEGKKKVKDGIKE